MQRRKPQRKWMDAATHTAKVIRVVAIRFVREGFTYRASALTYTSLLALVPLVALLFFILSAFPVFQHVAIEIQAYIFSHFVPGMAQEVQVYLGAFARQASALPALGIAMLIVTAIMLLLTIERSFNEIWHVQTGRRGLNAFLTYWAIITLGPILIGVSVLLSSYLFSLRMFTHVTSINTVVACMPFVLSIIGFAFLNIVVPNCKVRLRYGLLGGIVSAILFDLARRVFAWYSLHFPIYDAIYGALAVIPLFLLWVYFSWLIILLGALLSHTAATEYKAHLGVPVGGFMQAILVLEVLWEGYHEGRGFTLKQLQHRIHENMDVSMERMLQVLMQHKFVKKTSEAQYFMAYCCSDISLQHLIDALPWHLPSQAQLEALHQHPRLRLFVETMHDLRAAQTPYLQRSLAVMLGDKIK